MYLWYRYNVGTAPLPNGRVFFIFRLWLGYSAPRPNLTKGSLLLPSCLIGFNFSSTRYHVCMKDIWTVRLQECTGRIIQLPFTTSTWGFMLPAILRWNGWMSVLQFVYMFLRRSVLMVIPRKWRCVFCIMQVEEPTVYREVSTLILWYIKPKILVRRCYEALTESLRPWQLYWRRRQVLQQSYLIRAC